MYSTFWHLCTPLTSPILLQVLQFHTALRGVEVNGETFEDFCLRIPVADLTLAKRRRRRQRSSKAP